MCGIAGYWNVDGAPASESIVRRMATMIAHRGPDDEGTYVDGPVALGHRRLSIIDLSPAGRQPMQTPDGRYTLVYNGEIYNFSELKLQLQSRGCQFRSRTDSEVLLYALAEWGTGALERLNGMFAFVLHDATERTLLLGRDRYGIKPLYYYRDKDVFLFGSEIKSFLGHPDFRASLDMGSLVEYFTFQNFFTERTLFENVSLLPAAHWMRVSLNDSASVTTARYWDYHFESEQTPRTESEYIEELEYLFRQAVSRQLVGDRSVASYLSGGMDSGAITAVASPQIDEMLTFTVGFDRNSRSGLELATDEREKAEHMSYLFGTRHYEVVLKAGDMERCLPALVWHLEEPRVGQSYPNFYAANLASRFGKVVLAGTGGDELFGGYPWRYYRAVSNRDFEEYIDKYYEYWQRLIPNRILWEIFEPVRDRVGHVWTRDIFRDVFYEHGERVATPEDYVNHSLYLEARTFLHGLLLVEDKLSMAHGLETRVPFLDNDLVDFAMRLPVKHKLGNLTEVVRLNENEGGAKVRRYFDRTKDGKLLLRKMLSRYVPRTIAEGVKQGFSGPDNQWFKGDSIEYVRDRLLDTSNPIYQWMDGDVVRGLVQEHLNAERNRRLLVWSLLYFTEWVEQFLKFDHVQAVNSKTPSMTVQH